MSASFGSFVANRLRLESRALCREWLERLEKLLPVKEHEIFPADELLDRVPELLVEVAADLASPESHEMVANAFVQAKTKELGELRHGQNASVHQILREFDLLATVLDEFLIAEVERAGPRIEVADCLRVQARLHRAVRLLLQATVDTYTAKYTTMLDEQNARFESYNRMVSHELRTPIGTLEMGAELLATEDDPGERGRLIEVMRRNAARTRRILEGLDSVRGEQCEADERPNVQWVELEALVRDVVGRLDTMARERGVAIRVGSPLPALEGDLAKLEMVTRNLVANAIKYSDSDKPERHVEIDGGEEGEAVYLTVRDNGLGMPDEEQDRVFERFVRLHADEDGPEPEGHGLGLAIARDCVRAMRGRIDLDSRLGEGTTFRVRLPRRVESAS